MKVIGGCADAYPPYGLKHITLNHITTFIMPPVPEKNAGPSFSAGSGWRTAVVLLALGLLCAAIYGHTIHAPFVFDDLLNITKNTHIRVRELSLSALAGVFKSRETFRPVTYLSLAFNYYLHRYDVAGYHIFNWLIHLVNGMLIYLLTGQTLRLLKKKLPAAPFLAAALWLSSPVHIQSVTYIIQRMTSLATMFYLAALALYIHARTLPPENRKKAAPLLAGSALCGLFALTSKEIAVTLPIMLFLYEWFFIRNLEAGFVRKQAAFPVAAVGAATVIAFIYMGGHPVDAILSKYDNMPFTMKERLLTQPRVILHYFSLFLLPLPERLNIDHYVEISNSLTSPPATLAALALLTAAAVMAVLKARRNRLFAFAVVWFLGNLAVESSFVGLEMMFEHRTYLPSVFLFIAAVCGLMERVRPRQLAVATLALLIAVSGFWTYRRNATWADEIAFWQDAVRKSPKSIRPHNNLGRALALAGRPREGIAACRQAIAMSPPHINPAEAHTNIARMHYLLGDNEKAIEYNRLAIQFDPELAEAHLNLGQALLDENHIDEAITRLETALRLGPWLTPAYTLLARAHYQKTGHAGRAMDICRRALTVDPDYADAESMLGALLQNSGDLKQGLFHLQRVLDRFPEHPQANLNAGLVFNKLKQPEQAIIHLTRVVKTMPDNAPARAELGAALMAVNRLDEARKHLVRSLDLSPNDPAVLTRLAVIGERQQRSAEAAYYYRKALAAAPDSPQLLDRLALVLAEGGQLDEAAAALEKLEQLLPESPTVSYNLACVYARKNQPDQAVEQLKKAVDKGYDDWETLRTDTDLKAIRDRPYYKKLVTSLEQ